MLGRKEKTYITIKAKYTTRGNKPEGTGERRETKKIQRQNKTIQKK